MADQRYYNMNAKGEDNRYKVNTNILRMMQANPALGTGYIIGSMLGENYWGKKRAKTKSGLNEEWRKLQGANGAVGADANGVYGTNSGEALNEIGNALGSMQGVAPGVANELGGSVGSAGALQNPALISGSNGQEWSALNRALEAYKRGDGRVIADPNGYHPQTPQQANKPAVTLENAGNGGGAPSVADAWNNMNNASTYNPGGTTLYTGGARNLGNVIGADANGVFGVTLGNAAPSAANFPTRPQAAPPAPIPYTAEQLQQIKDYGGFTPEELKRMGAAELVAPPQAAPSQADVGLLTSVVNAAATNAAKGDVPQANNTVYEADAAPNLAVAQTPADLVVDDSSYDWPTAQPQGSGYKSAINWADVRKAQPTFNLPTVNIVDDRPKTWNEAFARRANQQVDFSLPQVNIVDDRPKSWKEAFARR